MTAIEVYQKIAAAIEESEPKDVVFALNFIQQEWQQKLYSQQQVAGAQLGLNNACYPDEYYTKAKAQQEAAIQQVREIVHEEIKALNPNVEPVAA